MADHRDDLCRRAFRNLRRAWPAGTASVLIEVHDADEDERWDLVGYPVDVQGRHVDGEFAWVAERIPLAGEQRDRVELLAECARAAGGYPWPLYVAAHDSGEVIDVRSGRWVRDVEVWGVRRFSTL